MKHIMQPNRWSCSVASAAMCMDICLNKLVGLIGHDGSEVVFPDLEPPTCYAGFSPQEIIDASMRCGYSVTSVETMPRCTPDGDHVRDVFPEDKIIERVEWYLSRFNCVAAGERNMGGRRYWHNIAWSKDEQRWHDPSGPVTAKDHPTVDIAVLYVYAKNEMYYANHMLDCLLSKNS